ncbi:sugar transferase [Oricola thermophila]|uniref:Sugar transferase n=2 Tax=Oricola thermophila TaxID=2742145 RepID=A0A6N1VI18_9HYPH|nr:sugar transferase [Oricola thermophila]
MKRVLDIVIATVALLSALPLMLVVGLVLKLSGGPVFFVHERVGFRGRTFGCLKFRSMVQNPDRALQDYLAANPEARTEWEETRKLRKDPRITFFGHVLRRSSIDELPQLINILRGDMSCVGPRPVTREELDLYGDKAPLYLQTRPGLTGLWQTSGRNRLSYDQRVALDSTYVREWSLLLDFIILFRTIHAVIRADETC